MIPPIRHILLDIEGTTCPVTFVSEVLFPYAARQVGAYITRHGHEDDLKTLLAELLEAWRRDEDPEARALLLHNGMAVNPGGSPSGEGLQPAESTDQTAALLEYIQWLIRNDRKLTPWKDLQGRIWREGYASGELRASLFPDVATTLRRWKERGLDLSVYSSGSVPAQQLLYGHSDEGDLRPLFNHWFDTRIGLKQEAASYQAILEVLETDAPDVLFISDSTAELRAARAVGLQVMFSDREGNPERAPDDVPSIQSLDQLPI